MVMVWSGAVRPGALGRSRRKCDNRCVTTDTTGNAAANATPTRIHADRGAGTLEIDWADGHSTVYGFESLRWLCPCHPAFSLPVHSGFSGR